MAFTLNKVYLSGNIGSPPRVATTRTGAEYCTFSIAYNPRRFNAQTNQWEQQATEWFSISVFNRPQVEICKALPKGAAVVVEGVLRSSTYVDKATNTERTSMNIVAESIFAVDRSVGRNPNGSFGNAGFGNQGFNGGYGDQNSFGSQGFGGDFAPNQGNFNNNNFGNNQGFGNNNGFNNNGFANNNSFGQANQNSFGSNNDFAGNSFGNTGDSFGANSFGSAPASNGFQNDFAPGGFDNVPNNAINRTPPAAAEPVAEEPKAKPTIAEDDLPF